MRALIHPLLPPQISVLPPLLLLEDMEVAKKLWQCCPAPPGTHLSSAPCAPGLHPCPVTDPLGPGY